jgi:hypothetical protein
MSAQTDFIYDVERACGLAVDAACACRTAQVLPLPHPHRRLLATALRGLETAQDALFKARNDPWSPPAPPKHHQMELL